MVLCIDVACAIPTHTHTHARSRTHTFLMNSIHLEVCVQFYLRSLTSSKASSSSRFSLHIDTIKTSVFFCTLRSRFSLSLPLSSVRKPGVACAATDAGKWKAKKMIQGDKYGFYLQKRQRMEWKKKKRQNVIKSDASTERQNENDSRAREIKNANARVRIAHSTNRPELYSVLKIKKERKRRKQTVYMCIFQWHDRPNANRYAFLYFLSGVYERASGRARVRVITRLKVKNPIKFFTHLNGA